MAKKSVVSSDGTTVAEFNMTPMIDVTFQLILFFILVGQVASDDLAQMILPAPTESQTHDPDDLKTPLRIILNIASRSESAEDLGSFKDADGARVGFYLLGKTRIDARNPDALVELRDTVKELLKDLTEEQKDKFAIEIRADKRLRYDQVAPAMFTVSSAGLTNMQITALRKGA